VVKIKDRGKNWKFFVLAALLVFIILGFYLILNTSLGERFKKAGVKTFGTDEGEFIEVIDLN